MPSHCMQAGVVYCQVLLPMTHVVQVYEQYAPYQFLAYWYELRRSYDILFGSAGGVPHAGAGAGRGAAGPAGALRRGLPRQDHLRPRAAGGGCPHPDYLGTTTTHTPAPAVPPAACVHNLQQSKAMCKKRNAITH